MCQLFVLRAEENKAQVINPTRPWMNAPRPRELMRGQMEGVGFDNSRPPSAASHAPSAAPLRSEVNSELNFPPNFEGLVLGCIDADFCK